MAPLGLIFGLLVGFLVADVWADRARAASAVSQEASALRDIDLLAGAFPASQPQVRQLLREQIDNYVATEWPQMSAGQATLVVAPAQLVQAQSPRAEPADRHRRPTGGSEPARRDDRSGHWRLGARAWR